MISNDEDMNKTAIAAVRRVDSRILYLRDQKIILDVDLAELYGVEVRHLNQQVKRNSKRFPAEFMFQLSNKDMEDFETTICDLKRWPRRAAVPASCLHRIRRNHGRHGVEF